MVEKNGWSQPLEPWELVTWFRVRKFLAPDHWSSNLRHSLFATAPGPGPEIHRAVLSAPQKAVTLSQQIPSPRGGLSVCLFIFMCASQSMGPLFGWFYRETKRKPPTWRGLQSPCVLNFVGWRRSRKRFGCGESVDSAGGANKLLKASQPKAHRGRVSSRKGSDIHFQRRPAQKKSRASREARRARTPSSSSPRPPGASRRGCTARTGLVEGTA